MNAVTRKTLFAHMVALSALGLMACPPPTPGPDGGTGGGSQEGCIDDTDCGDPTYFFCNTVTAECEPSCRTNAQCNQRPAGAELPECMGALGCQCDDAKCVGTLCSSDSECGTQVCRNGACVTPPTAATVAKCEITPDLAVMRTGSTAKFYVSAWDASNNPVVVKEGATWTAVGTAVTGSGTGASASFTAGTAEVTAATNAVQAAFGGT
ncbi:MAG: carboxypeptidase regulatory-like domain-containing protein, partial [Archangium sp.]